MKYLLVIFVAFSITGLTHATDRRGRLGAGMSSQLQTGQPSISFKLQKSKSFALGGVFGVNSNEQSGGLGGAIKLYRNIFDEPQLNFYASGLVGFISKKTSSVSQSGFQVDLTLGSEFSFRGLGSLGFSFEFGLSLNKIDSFVVETVGNNFIIAGIHFYL
ncbi:MAG: hypothetical protein HN576_06220 [Bacteriovoracaceae bacterium]|jgi:hypothetical protein|nr:hypothetical protein [Bacteriovoracaceae bacterium]